MGRKYLCIIALFAACISHINAQVSLVASHHSGCDSLKAEVFLSPGITYDTVTTISWIVDGREKSNSDTLRLTIDQPGSYSVSARLNNNLLVHLNSDLLIYNSPSPAFAYNDTASTGKYGFVFRSTFHELDSLDYSYTWIISDRELGHSAAITHSFNEKGTYPVELIIEDNRGCSRSIVDNIIVSGDLSCPNVFTPNMDGINDYFEVSTDGTTIYNFQVFSRSGLKVYHSESPTIFWDGRSLSGLEMQPGIYYYTIESVNTSEPEETNGFVHLFR